MKWTVGTVVLLVVLVFGGFRFFEKIDNGNVGIRYSMSGGVKDTSLSQGVHFVGLDKVTQYPIRSQTVKQRVGLATKDGKKTAVKISYTYHVDATKAANVYKKFGSADIKSIENGWLNQKLQKAGREQLSKYSLLDVMGSGSAKVQGAILKDFQKSVEDQGFIIEDLSFGVPDVDAQTQKSIDDLIKASQDNERAKLEAKTKKTKAQADADAKVARAEGEAKANKEIANSITDKNIQYMEAQARQKHGWVTVQGNGGVITNQTQGN
ncbi:prohibitin family protein [Limosilactobacillus reuteri]|uniref:prohibitin family protein n=1 Tax=Limosilactobacillus reuteri TaxID=1598 RepID=UPI001E593D27|nr:prohibitin family protein [Limosilactobacillus reuteri]MCC4466432.1 prohibitin family protein [Limosilactobacillus reuteri]MCC4474208.1 prohibitin family protein [Limosilactobacillus reuteri]